MDDAKIRYARNDKRCQAPQGLIVIERARQDIAGISEKGEAFLARFRFSPGGLFQNQLLPFFRLPFYLFGLFKEVDKDSDLRQENFRDDRRENVIDRA